MADSPKGGTEKTVTDHKKNSTEHFHYITCEVHSQCSPISIHVPYTCTYMSLYMYMYMYIRCTYVHVHVQWNLFDPDTLGTKENIQFSEVGIVLSCLL